jgi:hypothetical protein
MFTTVSKSITSLRLIQKVRISVACTWMMAIYSSSNQPVEVAVEGDSIDIEMRISEGAQATH